MHVVRLLYNAWCVSFSERIVIVLYLVLRINCELQCIATPLGYDITGDKSGESQVHGCYIR